MRWLIVTSQFPWPIVHGQWLRIYHIARTLRKQEDAVSILTFPGDAEGEQAYGKIGVDIVAGLAGRHVRKGPGRSLLSQYAYDPGLADLIAAQASNADVVLLSHSRMLQYSPEASLAGRVIADIGDDPVLEYGRRSDRPRGIKAWLRSLIAMPVRTRYERKFLGNVDATTFVSSVDAESFSRRHYDVKGCCVPNGVDVDYLEPPQGWSEPDGRSPVVVFTGHMSNPNNVRAAEFLVRDVAPHVWRKRPEVRLQIVGADPTVAVRALLGSRVEVTGRVRDIRPYLWNATVVALPMQSGTGIKNKLLEAWAASAPVVATPLACQGVTARDGENLLIGRSAEDVAERILELLANDSQRSRLAKAGRTTVVEQFTWESATDRLRQTVALTQGTKVAHVPGAKGSPGSREAYSAAAR